MRGCRHNVLATRALELRPETAEGQDVREQLEILPLSAVIADMFGAAGEYDQWLETRRWRSWYWRAGDVSIRRLRSSAGCGV